MSDTKSNTNSQTNHQEEKRSVETKQPPAMQQTQEVSQESNAVLNHSLTLEEVSMQPSEEQAPASSTPQVVEQPNVHLDKFKQMATNIQNFVREAEPKGQFDVMDTSEVVRGLELNEMDRQEVGADMLAIQPTPTIQETPPVAQSPPVTAETIENAGQATGSSIQMDAAMQEQGRELQELMRMFRQSTTTPLLECVLQTPSHKAKLSENTPAEKEKTQSTQRKSPRLKAKKKSDKSIIKLAQDLVAKKCGILQEDEEIEQLTL
jgi:hypothetical protein